MAASVELVEMTEAQSSQTESGLEILARIASLLIETMGEHAFFKSRIDTYNRLLTKAQAAQNQIAEALAHQVLIESLASHGDELFDHPMYLKDSGYYYIEVSGIHQHAPSYSQAYDSLYRWENGRHYYYSKFLASELAVCYESLRAYSEKSSSFSKDDKTLDGIIVNWVKSKVPKIKLAGSNHIETAQPPRIVDGEMECCSFFIFVFSGVTAGLISTLVINTDFDNDQLTSFVFIASTFGVFAALVLPLFLHKMHIEVKNPTKNNENRAWAAFLGLSLGVGIGLAVFFAEPHAHSKHLRMHENRSPIHELGLEILISSAVGLSFLFVLATMLYQHSVQKNTNYVNNQILLSRNSAIISTVGTKDRGPLLPGYA
jgi:hypothetical protein